MQTGEQKKSCAVCRKGDHDSVFLTDQDNKDNGTWWQSQTMFEGIQDSNKVQITLALGKSQFCHQTNQSQNLKSSLLFLFLIFRKELRHYIHPTIIHLSASAEHGNLSQKDGKFYLVALSILLDVLSRYVSFT